MRVYFDAVDIETLKIGKVEEVLERIGLLVLQLEGKGGGMSGRCGRSAKRRQKVLAARGGGNANENPTPNNKKKRTGILPL